MKPQHAFGFVTAATLLVACCAAWLTPQQQVPAPTTSDAISAPVVFSVR
jgi:hypothetical protein